MGQLDIWRWETATRWYEAAVAFDLLGDWIVVRRWGGLGSRRTGHMTELAEDYAQALRRLERIDAERRKRPVPYRRVGSAHDAESGASQHGSYNMLA